MSVGSPAHGALRGALPLSAGARRTSAAAPAALVVLTVLAAVLRFYGISRQGYWFDEANTALLVRFSPGKMLGLIPQSESTPPLYYCIAWVWSRVFSDAEAGLRSLSAVAGVLTVPVAFATADKLATRRAAVTVAALTACSPLLIWYSQEARSYELLVLFTGLALLAFAHALDRPDGRRVTLWALACALAMATHYFAVVAVIPQACWLLAAHRDRRTVWAGVGVMAVCGLALIPLALSQNGTGNDSWIASAPLGLRLAQVVPQFLIGTGAPDRQLWKWLAFAVAAAALVLLAARTTRSERRGPLLAGALALGGFVIALALIVAGFDELITRNLIALWLPAAVLVGGGLAASRAPRIGAALTAGLCAIGIFATVAIASDRNLQRPDWRVVARALGPPPAGGRAILIQHYAYLLPLSLYLPHLHILRHPARVSELEVISMRSPQQPLCWWGAACNLIPSTMQASYPITGLHSVSVTHVRQFTIRRLVAQHPIVLTRASVAAALTTTRLVHDVLIDQPH